MSDRSELIEHIKHLAVVHGRVTLTSGKEADYYVDMRRVTLDGVAAPLVGRVMNDLVADWEFDVVGGMTMGADPVATAMLHAIVVRKQAKAHGMQRRIEGAGVTGRRVLVVEDTSTTGGSPLQAIEAVRAEGGEVVGVAVIVDRATGAAEVIEKSGVPYRYAVGLADLGLT